MDIDADSEEAPVHPDDELLAPKEEESGTIDAETMERAHIIDRVRLRRDWKGAATSLQKFDDIFADCEEGGFDLAGLKADDVNDGYSVVSTANHINALIKETFQKQGTNSSGWWP